MVEEKNFFNNSQKVFKFFRLWSYREGNNKTLLARVLKCLTVAFAGVILGIISLTDTIEEIQHGENAAAFTKGLYSLAIAVCTHKMFSAAFADDVIYTCIKEMQSISDKLNDTSDIDKSLNLYKKLFVVGVLFMNACTAFFMAAPLTTGNYRSLVFTPNFPYLNTVKTPNWQLIYLYEILGIFVLTVSTIAYDTLFCGMMCLCSGILSSICKEIRELDGIIENQQELEIKMKEIINKINEITQLTTKISDTFSMTTMTHIIYDCNILALGLFMITILPFRNLVFISMILTIGLVTFQLWIYCYFGQNVVNQREVLRRDLCFIRWYDASKNFKTMLLLTIFESQNDRYVCAGKIVPLSLNLFTEVIKKAYAFFTFLNESR